MNWYLVLWQDPKKEEGAYQALWCRDKDEAKLIARQWIATHPEQVCFVVLLETALLGEFKK